MRMEQLTVNVNYVANGKKESTFLTILPLHSMKAKDIFDGLMVYFRQNNVPLHTMVGFGSDGASTMRGVNGGVSSMFQGVSQFPLVCLHCICYVIALSAKEGLDTSRIAQRADELMRGIVAEFNYSATANRELEEIHHIFDISTSKYLRVFKFSAVRWLSRKSVMERIITLIPSILEYFRKMAQTFENTWYVTFQHFLKL